MTPSTTKSKGTSFGTGLAVAGLWLLAWHFIAVLIGQEILLVSPILVFSRLWTLVFQPKFWSAVFFSFSRIVMGFLLGIAVGSLLAVSCAKSLLLRRLLAPLITVVKVTPVASFIILALIWVKTGWLSTFISFLMVVPVIYANLYQGILSMDQKLVEMARVYKIPLHQRVLKIYIPLLLPHFVAGCSVGLGFCWKSGIAAEVIGLPKGSIGASLYQAKIFLETPDLLAWTVVVILISVLFEWIFMFLIRFMNQRLGGGGTDADQPSAS